MRFYDLLLETQTISQYLKSGRDFTPDSVKAVKNLVRQHISTFPFFRSEGTRYIDLFTSYFTYFILNTDMVKNAATRTKAASVGQWLADTMSIPNNALGFTSTFPRILDGRWTVWGDYIVNHANDNRKMSLFNTVDYTPEQLDKDVHDWHERLALNKSGPGGEGKVIIDLGAGWKWLSLNRGYCDKEAKSAGHCGNANAKEGDNILSLRDPENKVHLTFIVNSKILGESKGRGNSKPSPKFHPAIIKLLQSPYVNFIQGGGHAPDSNFELEDLDEETQKQLIAQKPSLGMGYFEYVMSQRGNLKDKLNKALNLTNTGREIQRVYRKGNQTWVALETFDNLKEIEEFLPKNRDGGFSWLEDDIDIHEPLDLDSLLQYYVPNEVQDALEKYYTTNNPGVDEEEWEEMDLKDKLENDDEMKQTIVHASFDGLQRGIEEEGWKDIKTQLGRPDENGYWINFDQHPWELTTNINNLKSLYKDYKDEMDQGGDWLKDSLKLSYDAPYNGYSDFSKEAFVDRLMEELPEEVRKLIKKPEIKKVKKRKFKKSIPSFKEWFTTRIES